MHLVGVYLFVGWLQSGFDTTDHSVTILQRRAATGEVLGTRRKRRRVSFLRDVTGSRGTDSVVLT